MSLKNGCTSFINCFNSAHKGLMNYSDNDKLTYLTNMFKFLFESFGKDLPYLLFNDFLYALKNNLFKNKSTEIIKEVSDKVVIIISGFGVTTGALPKIKEGIEKEGYDIYPIDNRVWFNNLGKIQKKTIRDVLKAISNNEGKKIVLFGYSYGGSIAHLIGDKYNIPQVTYGTPLDTNQAPFGVGAQYYGINLNSQKKTSTNKSINITEEFSFANPYPGERKIAKGVLSHFSPNSEKPLKLILESIQESFN